MVLTLCPKLVSLALVIDTTQLDGIDVESPGIYYDGLQELALGNSLIDSSVDIALVLSSLFPNLPEVNLVHWIGSTLGALFNERGVMESWTLVSRILGGFRKDAVLGQ
ncbi:hypothetical protein CY34DRAFT_600028 [Suillus luteus UH-Slu-Lm8-n1]|uniref:Uncharacterized protein n=1 Tax=Suillus luteus UH-Slu-Lm8-n1 TaxID=930992 RepID=A0A0D0BNK6_9AGAM|nr:hypothetical protein CY34DRAFT_600028 [Suillus luteus UH-Slu-Lm8-n1]